MTAQSDIDRELAAILSDTLGKTGYSFLGASISHEPPFRGVMMKAMRVAYLRGIANRPIRKTEATR